MNRSIFFFLSLLAAQFLLAGACLAQVVNGPISFQPGSDLQKRVLSPSPAAGATKQSKQATIGRGQTMIDTGDAKNSFWNEAADLDGAGNIANADLLWDGSSKILYAFAHTNLRCAHGRSTEGDILIGVYGKKNVLGKTAGSGWWVVELAQNQCQAPLPGLYGCKFDAQGNAMACGRAELDTRINDMSIVESTKF
jgi:hypothetical protein